MATVVGETIRISGHLGGDEDLTVRGRVEGKVDLTRTLIVEPSGIVKAEVAVRNALISGVVVGNITASDSVELTADARVVGDLTAPRVIIVDGASFKGRVDMGDLDIARPRSDRPAARPMATATATAPERRAPPAPPRPSAERVEAKVVATAGPAKRVKAPSAPPKPPPASGRKKKVKVKKRR
jgi:cytoskeletal protein CcmA (bactofilin family)